MRGNLSGHGECVWMQPVADHEPDAWQDGMLVFNLTDRIRDSIQQMLYRNLISRRNVFF